MFLLRIRLFTLIKNDFLMVLVKPRPFLPTMLKLSGVVGWPVMEWWPHLGDGAFKCSLNLSPKVLVDFPIYSSSQSNPWHLYQ